jgi:hypothetical protein
VGDANARTFQVQVNPAVTYNLRFYIGDRDQQRNNLRISVEGGPLLVVPNTAANVFTTVVTTGSDAGGILDLQIKDLLDGGWVLNGLDIWRDGTADPGEAPMKVADSGPGGAPVLTANMLQPVIENAITLLTNSGLTPEQVGYLRGVPVQIADLGAFNYAGLATPERVVIDDDGAGFGWSISTDFWSRAFEPAQRLDLLTVVAHEFGHVLGMEDLHDADHAHELMFGLLNPGEQRLGTVSLSILNDSLVPLNGLSTFVFNDASRNVELTTSTVLDAGPGWWKATALDSSLFTSSSSTNSLLVERMTAPDLFADMNLPDVAEFKYSDGHFPRGRRPSSSTERIDRALHEWDDASPTERSESNRRWKLTATDRELPDARDLLSSETAQELSDEPAPDTESDHSSDDSSEEERIDEVFAQVEEIQE